MADEIIPLCVPPSCLETSEMTLPASEVSLEAILLEEVLKFLREALMKVAVGVLVVRGMMWNLERSENC